MHRDAGNEPAQQGGEETTETPPPGLGSAPGLLASLDQQRQRALVRMRLFGDAPEPLTIGRFVPLKRLGAGGMGVVYVAHDGQLDRKIALKLLRSAGTSPISAVPISSQ